MRLLDITLWQLISSSKRPSTQSKQKRCSLCRRATADTSDEWGLDPSRRAGVGKLGLVTSILQDFESRTLPGLFGRGNLSMQVFTSLFHVFQSWAEHARLVPNYTSTSWILCTSWQKPLTSPEPVWLVNLPFRDRKMNEHWVDANPPS